MRRGRAALSFVGLLTLGVAALAGPNAHARKDAAQRRALRQEFGSPAAGARAFIESHRSALPAFIQEKVLRAATTYEGIIRGPNRTWINPAGDSLMIVGEHRRVRVKVRPPRKGHRRPSIVVQDDVQDKPAKNYNHSISRYQPVDGQTTYLTNQFGYKNVISSLFHGFVSSETGRGHFTDLSKPATSPWPLRLRKNAWRVGNRARIPGAETVSALRERSR